MERTRTINETVILGDLALDIDCDGNGRPQSVAIYGVTQGRLDPEKLKVQLYASELEQLAAVVRDVRAEHDDYRHVCAEHGLHDSTGKYSQCPTCHPAEPAIVTDRFDPGEAA